MIFYLEHEGRTIAVKTGELGYWEIHSRAKADDLNDKPLPPEVMESALAASMFGWHTPAANAALAWEKENGTGES